jgi:hypothetical protein
LERCLRWLTVQGSKRVSRNPETSFHEVKFAMAVMVEKSLEETANNLSKEVTNFEL